MRTNKNNSYILFLKLLVLSLFFLPVIVSASQTNGTVASSSYAWGENLGWVNLGCDGCNVHVTDTALTGYAWSSADGWINLQPASSSGVTNNCLGQLGGDAWSSHLGFVDFSGATINASGTFEGIAGDPSSKAGRINFSCTNCGIQTDWLQCALRSSPAQIIIQSMGNLVVPSITANVNITNEGGIGTEYQYEWCVVTDPTDSCGDPDNIFDSMAAKFLNPGQSFNTVLAATVPNPGNYYFKAVVYFGSNRSVATQTFTATAPATSGGGGGGGGGSGGGGLGPLPPIAGSDIYDTADLNRDHIVDATDFSILLYFWKTKPPFKNIYVDINKDGKVDSIDFSIMLSQWGHTTPGYNPLTAQ